MAYAITDKVLGTCAAILLLLPGSFRAEEQPIPVADLFSHPLASDIVISPNGEYLAAILSSGGDQYLTTLNFRGDEPKPLLKTADPNFRIGQVVWGNDDLLLISASTKFQWAVRVQARATQLYSLPREGGERPKHLAAKWPGVEYSQIQDNFLSMLRGDPEHVLLQYHHPERKWPQPVLVKLSSGGIKQWGKPFDNIFSWYATARGDVRVGSGLEEISRTEITVARGDVSDKFQIVNERTAGDAVFSFAGYSPDPTRFYVFSDHESGRNAIYLFDFEQRAFVDRIFSHDRVDVGQLLYFETRDEPYAVSYLLEAPQYHFLDTGLGEEIASVSRQLGRTPWIESASADGQRLILSSSDDTHPPVYWWFDRPSRAVGRLAATHPALKDGTFQPMRPITFEARDGTKLSGYLTVPAEGTDQRWPTIVLVHGGPTARDYIGWDPEVQFFVNRGYAVLQVNFRGSAGFGRDFQVSGNNQWGLAMQDDIADGVRWLIEQGVADAERICIYGASYGGYAAMMGLIRTPELYKCGASYAGVMDLIGMLRDNDWYAGGEMIQETVGDPRRDAERLKQTSPFENVHKINAPVLLAHGEFDERIHVRQTEKMAKALQKAGKPVEVIIFPFEIHGFKEEKNRIEFYSALIAFFDKHLSVVDAQAHKLE